jgi:tetratricopeptide (TPR) repeat protein
MTAPVVYQAAFLVVLASVGDLATPFLEPGSREAKRGLESYRTGEWVEAIAHFKKALEEESDPVLNYNLGAAAYKGQNYPEALEAYQAAARSTEMDQNRVEYDVGNVRYRAGDLQGALESYRGALRADPGDEDARYNYELTLRQLESSESEEEQNQDQPGEEGENKSENQSGEAPPDSTGQSQPQSGEEQEGEQGESQPQPDDEESGEQEEPQGADGGDGEDAEAEAQGARAGEETRLLSPEEAIRLLNAVTPEERELLEARLKSSRRRKVEKDW